MKPLVIRVQCRNVSQRRQTFAQKGPCLPSHHQWPACRERSLTGCKRRLFFTCPPLSRGNILSSADPHSSPTSSSHSVGSDDLLLGAFSNSSLLLDRAKPMYSTNPRTPAIRVGGIRHLWESVVRFFCFLCILLKADALL